MENVHSIDHAKGQRLKIGDLARLAKKSTRALRLYEEMGLLGAYRTAGGHRLYSGDALVRLAWIDKLQTLGFSLNEISELLSQVHEVAGPEASTRVRDVYRKKLEDIRTEIKALGVLALELEESLAYLETCNSCDPATLFASCANCDHDHLVKPPTLITGIHRGEGGPT